METFKLYKSKTSGKKYDVWIPWKGRIKKVSFGGKGYSDFTIHKDIERRARYRIRHKSDHIKDPSKAGFWSWYALWGESSDLTQAFNQAVRIAKRLLAEAA